jgi:hypothetical protein
VHPELVKLKSILKIRIYIENNVSYILKMIFFIVSSNILCTDLIELEQIVLIGKDKAIKIEVCTNLSVSVEIEMPASCASEWSLDISSELDSLVTLRRFDILLDQSSPPTASAKSDKKKYDIVI